jgi:hypothetical protein
MEYKITDPGLAGKIQALTGLPERERRVKVKNQKLKHTSVSYKRL